MFSVIPRRRNSESNEAVCKLLALSLLLCCWRQNMPLDGLCSEVVWHFLVGYLKQVLILKKFCSFHSVPCKKQKWHPSGSLSATVEMTWSMPLFKKMWEGFCIQSGIVYSPTSSPMKAGWDRICQVLCHSTPPCKSALNSIKRRDHRWASFHFRSQDPFHIKLSMIPIDTLGGSKLMTCIWDIGFIHVYKFTVPNLWERQVCPI